MDSLSAVGLSAAFWLLVVFVVLRAHTARRRRLGSARAEVLRRHGLEVVADAGDPSAAGVTGRLRVTLRDRTLSDETVATELHLEAERPFDLTLRLEADLGRFERDLMARELEIGDPRFDGVFLVGGVPARARALLDAATRQGLLSLAATQPFELRADGWSLTARSRSDGEELAHLTRLVPRVLDLARSLAEPGEVPARLARNAATDPLPSVRLYNLLTLLREFPEHPEVGPALEHAARDEDAEMRLRAAVARGA
jgi:hypothetical protein